MTARLLSTTIAKIGPLDEAAMWRARARQDVLTKPQGSLGRLEELSAWLAGVTANPLPQIRHKLIVTAAADHGVAAQGVSAYPQEVTAQMVGNFLRGGAAINVLARQVGARIMVVDAGVATETPLAGLVSKPAGRGTADMSRRPAMSRSQALTCLEAGVEVIKAEMAKGADIVGVGDMGIANTTAASAVTAAITGLSPRAVTGRGTGVGDDGLWRKVAIIERALAVNHPDPGDALDVLAKVGGFEIGFLAGVMLAAAAARRPVVLDGFITGAAALIGCGLCPRLGRYLLASHLSVEPGHQAVLDWLQLRPLFDLGMRLGEGTGAALGIFLVEAAARCLAEMATFAEAGVSQRRAEETPLPTAGE
jgi:nicotinate-nucleotide--dimethylbenzimidazole phosphoribosyltransferase